MSGPDLASASAGQASGGEVSRRGFGLEVGGQSAERQLGTHGRVALGTAVLGSGAT